MSEGGLERVREGWTRGAQLLWAALLLPSCSRKPALPCRARVRQARGKIFCPEPAFTLPCLFLCHPAGITVTNHPMNKTSASLSLDYL